MNPILGFTPDVDPVTPGCILECSQLIPSDVGMRAAPSLVSPGLPALSAEARGAVVTRNLSGTRRFIAGSSTKLQEANSTAWADVSAATYALGSDDRWSFVQFGDTTLAATITQKIQRSPSTTFATITSAPKAQIVEAAKGFVLAFHTNETTYGDQGDRWWCSALYDDTDWTPNVATQCTTGRLVGAGGSITAARRFGDDVIAYKNRAIFHGRYVGPAEVWNWQQIAGDIGCVGQDAVVDTGMGHVFVGEDDIYHYDGVRPQPIASGSLRQWFINNRNPIYTYKTQLLWDRVNRLVWIFFVSNSSTTLDDCIVYHMPTQRWGRAANNIEACVSFITPSITYDGGTPLVTDYDTGPMVPFDSPFWVAGSPVPAVFNTSHVIQTLSGTPGESSFTTGDYGDDEGYAYCGKLYVRYKLAPTSAAVTGFTKDDTGALVVQSASTASRADNGFDVRQSGRWHRFMLTAEGAYEVTAIRPKLQPDGAR